MNRATPLQRLKHYRETTRFSISFNNFGLSFTSKKQKDILLVIEYPIGIKLHDEHGTFHEHGTFPFH